MPFLKIFMQNKAFFNLIILNMFNAYDKINTNKQLNKILNFF